jgi:hypothetical protein
MLPRRNERQKEAKEKEEVDATTSSSGNRIEKVKNKKVTN